VVDLMERQMVENGDRKVEAELLSVLFNFTATMRAILIRHLKSTYFSYFYFIFGNQ